MEWQDLIDLHPTVFHMASVDAWPSIRQSGLLSTAALLDLFEVHPEEQAALLSTVRRKSVTLEHPDLGTAVVRDQLPLKFLDACLEDGATPEAFLHALNTRVYFWATEERARGLLAARAYRRGRHLLFAVNTADLVERHGARMELAPYNTGSMHVPTAPRRGPNVFASVADYDYWAWRRKRGRSGDALVEVTVRDGVTDFADLIEWAEIWTEQRLERSLSRGDLMRLHV